MLRKKLVKFAKLVYKILVEERTTNARMDVLFRFVLLVFSAIRDI